MDKSVYAAEVNEYTVRCNVLGCTFEDLSFFKFRDDFFALCFQFGFDKSLVGNDDIAEFLIDFNNFEFHGFAYENIVVAYRMNINLTSRKEGFDSEYIYNHTTLCTALDEALDNLIVL